jgi:prevent-host-death family protein
MNDVISIKELRGNLADVADRVELGMSYTVFRRSKKSFKIVPIDHDEEWETVVDFTDDGKRKGEKIEDVLRALEELNS